MKTKKQRLLDYLKTHKKGITGQDALKKFGLYRLSGEIHQLRNSGYNIVTSMEEREEPDGTITTYARYYLKSEGAEK